MAAIRAIAPSLAARAIVQSATIEGARALGFADELGSIAVGKRAQLIAVKIPPGVTDVEEYLVSGVPSSAVDWLAPA